MLYDMEIENASIIVVHQGEVLFGNPYRDLADIGGGNDLDERGAPTVQFHDVDEGGTRKRDTVLPPICRNTPVLNLPCR